ncbi:MAG: hypothetical protein PHI97_32680, partial [Desulfobulbus sp.]|nr:hypothetical protein [Desulfobulbus sp.]
MILATCGQRRRCKYPYTPTGKPQRALSVIHIGGTRDKTGNADTSLTAYRKISENHQEFEKFIGKLECSPNCDEKIIGWCQHAGKEVMVGKIISNFQY